MSTKRDSEALVALARVRDLIADHAAAMYACQGVICEFKGLNEAARMVQKEIRRLRRRQKGAGKK